MQEKYVSSLCLEIQLTAKHYPPSQPLQTIFFGGGTPSLLPVRLLSKIIQTIHNEFDICPDAEISLEANPESLSLTQLQEYRQLGINRISLGVQAFQLELLKLCGRAHRVDEVYLAISNIKQAGFTNFSLDLISGLPTQTMQDWQFSLNEAIAQKPTHLSVYDLIIAESTAFHKRYGQQKKLLPPEELTVAMYIYTRQELMNSGYLHYEISNFAKPNFDCKHNQVYWYNHPFYGFGMGATSYIKRQRIDRPHKFKEYIEMVTDWQISNIIPTAPKVNAQEELFDTLMQGLRLSTGINLEHLTARFGSVAVGDIYSLLTKFVDRGWVGWGNDRVYLTQPQGWLFSDQVIGELYDRLMNDCLN